MTSCSSKCALFIFIAIHLNFTLSQDVETLSTIIRAGNGKIFIKNEKDLENVMEIKSRPKENINITSGKNLTLTWTFFLKTDKIIEPSLLLTAIPAGEPPIELYACNDTKNDDETRMFRCSATEVAKKDKRYEGRLQNRNMVFYYNQFQDNRMQLPLYKLNTASDNGSVFTMTVNNLHIFNTTLYVFDMEEMQSLTRILKAVGGVAGAVFGLCLIIVCVNIYFDEGMRSRSKRNLVSTTKHNKQQNV